MTYETFPRSFHAFILMFSLLTSRRNPKEVKCTMKEEIKLVKYWAINKPYVNFKKINYMLITSSKKIILESLRRKIKRIVFWYFKVLPKLCHSISLMYLLNQYYRVCRRKSRNKILNTHANSDNSDIQTLSDFDVPCLNLMNY